MLEIAIMSVVIFTAVMLVVAVLSVIAIFFAAFVIEMNLPEEVAKLGQRAARKIKNRRGG